MQRLHYIDKIRCQVFPDQKKRNERRDLLWKFWKSAGTVMWWLSLITRWKNTLHFRLTSALDVTYLGTVPNFLCSFHSTSFFIKGKLVKKYKSAQMIRIRFTHVPSNLNKRSDLSLLKQIYNDRFFWRWPKLPWKKFNSPLFQYKQRLLVGIPCNPAHLSRVQNANSTGPRRTQN